MFCYQISNFFIYSISHSIIGQECHIMKDFLYTTSPNCTPAPTIKTLDDDAVNLIFRYLSPRDLLKLAMTGNTIKQMISMDRILWSILYSNNSNMMSMANLYQLMTKRAIYPPDEMRILRIACGRRCELCNKNVVAVLRPQWGVFVCWSCVTTTDFFAVEDRKRYNVTTCWHRAFWRGNKCHIKHYYLRHREAFFKIFEHERCLAYPYGYMDWSENPHNMNSYITRKDRYELVWNKDLTDKQGNKIGPLFHYNHIKALVQYLEDDESHTVDKFFRINLHQYPNEIRYVAFIDAYNKIYPTANDYYKKKSIQTKEKEFYNRCLKINRAITAIEKISANLIQSNFREGDREYIGYPSHFQLKALRRVLFCYHEEYHTSMKYCLTYDTGNHQLNRRLNYIMKPIMKAPSTVTNKKARGIAWTLFYELSSFLCVSRLDLIRRSTNDNIIGEGYLPCVYDQGDIRQDFNFRNIPRAKLLSNRFPPWRDTSSQRKY